MLGLQFDDSVTLLLQVPYRCMYNVTATVCVNDLVPKPLLAYQDPLFLTGRSLSSTTFKSSDRGPRPRAC